MIDPTAHALAAAIICLQTAGHEIALRAMINEIHKTEEGADTLRLVVKDDLLGTANVVANALWPAFANL